MVRVFPQIKAMMALATAGRCTARAIHLNRGWVPGQPEVWVRWAAVGYHLGQMAGEQSQQASDGESASSDQMVPLDQGGYDPGVVDVGSLDGGGFADMGADFGGGDFGGIDM